MPLFRSLPVLPYGTHGKTLSSFHGPQVPYSLTAVTPVCSDNSPRYHTGYNPHPLPAEYPRSPCRAFHLLPPPRKCFPPALYTAHSCSLPLGLCSNTTYSRIFHDCPVKKGDPCHIRSVSPWLYFHHCTYCHLTYSLLACSSPVIARAVFSSNLMVLGTK